MRRFLFKLIIFLLPIATSVVYLEHKLTSTPNSYKIKRQYLEAQLDSINILVLGSSETQSDIMPRKFNYHGFNLGNVAQPLYYDKALTLRYLDRLPHLHLAIITLNYTSFYYELSDTREVWRDYYYYRFWSIPNPELPCIDIKKVSLIALYSWPEVKKMLKGGFENDYTRGDKQIAYDGGLDEATIAAGLHQPGAASKTNDAKQMMQLINKSLKEKRFDENFSYLSTLLDSLTRRNIKIALVTAPVSKEMYEYMQDPAYVSAGTLAKNQMAVDSICRKYRCRYYDFSTDPRFQSSDFSNDAHLNGVGAIKFSNILNSEVVVPNY